MKKIKLHRPKESFNKNCSYEILLEKHSLTELKNGEEKIIDIPKELAEKSLKAKIQWCGSEKFDLKNITENEIIIVSGNKFLNRKMPIFGAIFPMVGLMVFNLDIVYIFINLCFWIKSGSMTIPNPGPLGTLIFPFTIFKSEVEHSKGT